MSQKANLITIRKKNRIELTVQNTKMWVSLYILIENISRLFSIKGAWVLKSFCGFDTNLVSLNLFLYYQTFKLSAFKKKTIKKKISNNVYLKNKSFFIFFQQYINIFGFNFFDFNVSNLNLFVNKKKLSILYKDLKVFSFNIFSRRFNLFIDFLKVTILFFDNYINLSSYINIWSRIFKNLHKRLHGKFFFFVKEFIKSLLKIKPSNTESGFKPIFSGVKFLLSGRIRGKSRASSMLIQEGSVPTQSIDKNIDFGSVHVYTLYGVFGIKMWTYFKK